MARFGRATASPRQGYGVATFDRLIACGAHEDCRNHLDLAMSCAKQRLSATHQVGEGQGR